MGQGDSGRRGPPPSAPDLLEHDDDLAGTGDGPGRPVTAVRELSLPPQASSSRQARRWVVGLVEEWGLEPLLEQVELLTSELVTNALLHAGTPMRVRVSRQGAGVRLEVHDGSSVVPSRRRYSRTATTGRGMGLLDSLADDWGWRTEAGGKVTWAFVETPRDAWGAFDLDDVMESC
jgi:anti-sigma regulatory factor (Ser/Thr protein kinase)